jgi:putative ABC transport system permease protein
MQNQDRVWELIAKKLAGEASEAELKELDEFLQQNPGTTYPVEQLTHLWNQPAQKDDDSAEQAFTKHLDRWAKEKADRVYEKQKTEAATWKDRTKKPWLFYTFINRNGLVNNYFKTTWRNLMRNRSFSFINISGLAIGMAGAVLILLWIINELTTDQFHQKKDRIYKVLNRTEIDGQLHVWGSTPQPLAPALKTEFPIEVEDAVRISWVASFVLRANEKTIQTQGYLTDPGFLTMFDFPLLEGNPKTALTQPYSIVITEQLAKNMFRYGDAMGKQVKIDSIATFTVTGVAKDLPANTTLGFDYLVPYSYMEEVKWNSPRWDHSNTMTTVLMKPGITEDATNKLIVNVKKNHLRGSSDELFAHPLGKWYLNARFENGVAVGGRIKIVRLFCFIAGFILLIACINYMNLSTARSEKRAREVGIRKVVGAGKGSLIGRFLGESIFISFIAGVFALLIVQLCLPWFNQIVDFPGFNVYTGKRLSVPYDSPGFWLAAIGFILITGILAGCYPAFYLARYKPISVLQKHYKRVSALITPRKVLVVVQFGFAIVLIISTIIIYRQILLGESRDPGYKQDNLAFVYVKGNMLKKYDTIRNELLGKELVTDITRTSSPVTDVWTSNDDYSWRGEDTSMRIGFDLFEAEDNFVGFHGLRLIAGRDFNAAMHPSDTDAVILTESAARRMGFKKPVGETITNEKGNWNVVGVIKDFIPEDPYQPPWPTIVHYTRAGFGVINFQLNPEFSRKEAKEKISEVFTSHNPEYVVEYRVIEEEYAVKFEYEKRRVRLAALFAGLTIFISCLGLFALAAYMAENRIKEIGVRKVLGASVSNITTLLSKDFLKLVIVSFLVASPVAWWLMNKWLQDYAYRVSISWWVFVFTGLVSVLIAGATVSYQAIKAARANPVESLRSE